MEKEGGQDSVLRERQQKWDEIVGFMEKNSDVTGRELDAGIIETVAALNALGYRTMGSCDGHLEDERLRFPYIKIVAPNEPSERFVGEREICERVASQFAVLPDEVPYTEDPEIDAAYWRELDVVDAQETDEYRAWMQANDCIENEVQGMIAAFAQGYASYHHSLRTNRISGGVWIEAVDASHQNAGSQDDLRRNIALAQEDMHAFGDWLKKRYFAGAKRP